MHNSLDRMIKYDDFSKIYRKYRALYRSKVGDYFFKETEDLVDKLWDDFELMLREQKRKSYISGSMS